MAPTASYSTPDQRHNRRDHARGPQRDLGQRAAGVEIRGGDSTSNLVEGNTSAPTADRHGRASATSIGVFINGRPETRSAGRTPRRNLISGNSRPDGSGVGVEIAGPENLIEGNFIGTDQSGGFPLGNDTGVFINGAAANTIGGTVHGACNCDRGQHPDRRQTGSASTSPAPAPRTTWSRATISAPTKPGLGRWSRRSNLGSSSATRPAATSNIIGGAAPGGGTSSQGS